MPWNDATMMSGLNDSVARCVSIEEASASI